MSVSFNSRLRSEVQRKQSRLCLGLDLDPHRKSSLHDVSLSSMKDAAEAIVEATWEKVWGYKLNFAFFERLGSAGYTWLEELAVTLQGKGILIGDGKRSDIGNSARGYAEAIFNHLSLDAATVNPYMGRDALEPFMAVPEKGAFVLCLTSNPGSADFQWHGTEQPLHLRVASWAQSLNDHDNLGLVVGATQPDHLNQIRETATELPFFMPGVGAQGGSLEQAVGAGTAAAPSIIVVSRGILYAGEGSLEDITEALDGMNAQINALAATHGT